MKEEIHKIENEETKIENKIKDDMQSLTKSIEGEKSLISGLYKR